MVTRRAVLKGTAAASIGAIAAAHGATPVEAAGEGYGQLAGGALGAFQKWRDAFQVSLKFHKHSADIFIKEAVSGGVDVFFKFFHKEWFAGETQSLSKRFPDLKSSELSFWKLDTSSAGIFIKNQDGATALATVDISTDGIFYKVEEKGFETDGQIG
jgi:hypothetical protein